MAAVTPRSVRSAAGGPSTPGGDAAAAVWGRKESTCRRRFPAPIGGCSARWAALTAVPAAAVPAPKTPNAPNRTGDAASCLGGLAGLGAGRPTVYEAETAAAVAAAPVAALAAAFRLRSAGVMGNFVRRGPNGSHEEPSIKQRLGMVPQRDPYTAAVRP